MVNLNYSPVSRVRLSSSSGPYRYRSAPERYYCDHFCFLSNLTHCRFASYPISGLGIIRDSPQRLDLSSESVTDLSTMAILPALTMYSEFGLRPKNRP